MNDHADSAAKLAGLLLTIQELPEQEAAQEILDFARENPALFQPLYGQLAAWLLRSARKSNAILRHLIIDDERAVPFIRAVPTCSDDPALEASVIALATSSSPKVRSAVVRAAGCMETSESLAVLRDALHDRDANVRWQAIESLCQRGDSDSAAEVEAIVSKPSSTSDEKLAAVSFFKEIATPNAIRVIERLLLSDDPETPFAALTALRDLDQEGARKIAMSRLTSSTDPGFRRLCTQILAEPDFRAVPERERQRLEMVVMREIWYWTLVVATSYGFRVRLGVEPDDLVPNWWITQWWRAESFDRHCSGALSESLVRCLTGASGLPVSIRSPRCHSKELIALKLRGEPFRLWLGRVATFASFGAFRMKAGDSPLSGVTLTRCAGATEEEEEGKPE